jgi:predicted PurR-regulated permease PerM
VPRVISFIVLLAIVLLVGAIFFQVMAQFFVPLFLAAVLLVVFAPVQRWIGEHVPDRPRLAALLTTVSIILLVVLPLVWLGWKAYVDFYALLNTRPPEAAVAQEEQPSVALHKSEKPETHPDAVADDTQQQKQVEHTLKTFVKGLVDPLANAAHVKVDDATIDRVVALASDFVAKVVITGVHSAIALIIGLFILVVALYYFLADGPSMVEAVMAVTPLDRRYEHELLQRFAEVSRAVVVATLVAALSQGALASIGYVLALPEQAPIFLLTALTTVFALIPIFGAFAVWGCVCGWLYVQGHVVAALSLAIYCTIVVSLIDNILKPLILHGQSKLHPLLALLSILGGIEAFGPVGILVGPMLVSFLQALLNMLRKEIESFGGPVGPSSKPLAESMVEAIQMASGENSNSNAKPAAQLGAEPAPARRSKRKR